MKLNLALGSFLVCVCVMCVSMCISRHVTCALSVAGGGPSVVCSTSFHFIPLIHDLAWNLMLCVQLIRPWDPSASAPPYCWSYRHGHNTVFNVESGCFIQRLMFTSA